MFCVFVVVGFTSANLASSVTILKSEEVEDLLCGNDEKYKSAFRAEPAVVIKYCIHIS